MKAKSERYRWNPPMLDICHMVRERVQRQKMSGCNPDCFAVHCYWYQMQYKVGSPPPCLLRSLSSNEATKAIIWHFNCYYKHLVVVLEKMAAKHFSKVNITNNGYDMCTRKKWIIPTFWPGDSFGLSKLRELQADFPKNYIKSKLKGFQMLFFSAYT